MYSTTSNSKHNLVLYSLLYLSQFLSVESVLSEFNTNDIPNPSNCKFISLCCFSLSRPLPAIRELTTTTSNEEEEEAAARLLLEELWIKHQIEQEQQDQHDLKLFYEIKKEESDIERAKKAYKRLVKKYVGSLSS